MYKVYCADITAYFKHILRTELYKLQYNKYSAYYYTYSFKTTIPDSEARNLTTDEHWHGSGYQGHLMLTCNFIIFVRCSLEYRCRMIAVVATWQLPTEREWEPCTVSL